RLPLERRERRQIERLTGQERGRERRAVERDRERSDFGRIEVGDAHRGRRAEQQVEVLRRDLRIVLQRLQELLGRGLRDRRGHHVLLRRARGREQEARRVLVDAGRERLAVEPTVQALAGRTGRVVAARDERAPRLREDRGRQAPDPRAGRLRPGGR